MATPALDALALEWRQPACTRCFNGRLLEKYLCVCVIEAAERWEVLNAEASTEGSDRAHAEGLV